MKGHCNGSDVLALLNIAALVGDECDLLDPGIMYCIDHIFHSAIPGASIGTNVDFSLRSQSHLFAH